MRDFKIYRPIVVIMDDVIGDKELHGMKPLNKMYMQGRHLYINPILLIQNITSVDPTVRKNTKIIWIFRTFSHTDLKLLLD